MKKAIQFLLTVFCVFILLGCEKDTHEQSVDMSQRAATSASSDSMPSVAKKEGDYIRFQRASIVDSSGFGQPIVAAEVLIPNGWQSQGGVVWQLNQTGCGKKNPHFSWGATSPDGKAVVEILPEETWSGNNIGGQQNGCPNVWVENSKEYLATWVEHFRPGATIRSFRPRDDISKQYQHFNRTDPFPGGQVRQWVDAGEVILDYQNQGQPYEEVLAMCVVFSLSSMQGVMPGEIRNFLTMGSMPGFSMRAPKGELNMRMAEVIRSSGRPNPKWLALMQQHNAKISAINRKGAMDRHRITMQTNREIMQMNQDSYEYRQKVMDEGHRKTVQAIRGVEDYVDPTTNEKFELPNTYNNAWRMPDDTYILTDDYDFDPYKDLGVEGQKLNAVR